MAYNPHPRVQDCREIARKWGDKDAVIILAIDAEGRIDWASYAIRAAEAITGGKYGDGRRFKTSYGDKTVMGVADIIDHETATPELLETLKSFSALCPTNEGLGGYAPVGAFGVIVKKASAAIAKAEGRKA